MIPLLARMAPSDGVQPQENRRARSLGTFLGVNAAADLVGKVLPGGWRVERQLDRRQDDTGGNFSINYWVVKDSGTKGFCKVLNYEWLMNSLGDPVAALREATSIFEFERDLARQCSGLSKVVTAIDDGSVMMDEYRYGLISYIIFEVADRDIRRLLNTSDLLDAAVRLRAIHNLATGIRQLHALRIAHQDVKPSNTLVFSPDEFGTRSTKVGDLGRATAPGRPMSHDQLSVAGDRTYAPPEALYGEVPSDFGPRRLACDLYQLGSMVSFIFTGSAFNALLKLELHPIYYWGEWRGSYREVMPYVRDAFGRASQRVAAEAPPEVSDRVLRLVRMLCEPDPYRRGHPRSVKQPGNQYALERIVTELDLLVRGAELRTKRSVA